MIYHSYFHFFDSKISLEKNQGCLCWIISCIDRLISVGKKLCNVMVILIRKLEENL